MPDARDERPKCTVVRTAAKYETFYSDVLYGFERDVVWSLGQDDHIRNLSLFKTSPLLLLEGCIGSFKVAILTALRTGTRSEGLEWFTDLCIHRIGSREVQGGRRNRMKRDSVSLKRNYLIEGSGTLLSKDPLKIGVQFLSRAYESA